MSLKTKLILLFFVSALLVLSLQSYLLFEHTKESISEETNAKTEQITTSLKIALSMQSSAGNAIRVISSLAATNNVDHISMVDMKASQVLADNNYQFIDRDFREAFMPSEVQALTRFIAENSDRSDKQNKNYIYKIRRVLLIDENNELKPYAMLLVFDVSKAIAKGHGRVVDLLAISTATFVFLLLILHVAINHILIAPVRSVIHTMREQRNSETPLPINLNSEDELNDIALEYNRLTESNYKKEKELEQQKDKAEEATKAKAEFLAQMSHEIRTPMNGVIGMLDILSSSELSNEQTRQLNLAQSSAKSLLTIINDILDFSKIEANKLELDSVSFSVIDTIKQILAESQILANSKGLKLKVFQENLQNLYVVGDPVRLRQILLNLISNAVKFTHEGSVTLKGFADLRNDVANLEFQVVDTGIGIAADKLAYIFDSFSQEDLSTTRKYGGTGLGLSISTQLARLMNGTLEVESEKGKGTTFTLKISLPVGSQCYKKSSEQLLRFELSDKLLVAEDNVINQEIIGSMLTKLGLNYDLANDGLEVIDRLAQSTEGYALILMDCFMPNLDGYEATQRIRNAEGGEHNKDISIIALTANAMESDKDKCFSAGMNDFVSKPIDIFYLQKVLKKYIS